MYRIVIFDCDGTLMDCSKMITHLYEGYHKLYPDRKALPYEHFIPCYYMSDRETRAYLHIPPEEQALFQQVCFGEADDFMSDIVAFDGILEVMRTLHAYGIRLGINTSRNREGFTLAKQQLQDVYDLLEEDLIATNDRIAHTKPAPDSLWLIQKQAHCDVSEILFVGDSINDALCAKAAGCAFAFAKWGAVSDQPVPCDFILQQPDDLLQVAVRKIKA